MNKTCNDGFFDGRNTASFCPERYTKTVDDTVESAYQDNFNSVFHRDPNEGGLGDSADETALAYLEKQPTL